MGDFPCVLFSSHCYERKEKQIAYFIIHICQIKMLVAEHYTVKRGRFSSFYEANADCQFSLTGCKATLQFKAADFYQFTRS